MRRLFLGDIGLVLVAGSLVAAGLTGCGSSTASTANTDTGKAKSQTGLSDGPVEGSGKGMAAIRQAADAGKYLFMFFSKTDDDQTLAMRKVFDKAMEKVADRAQWIAVTCDRLVGEGHRGQVRSEPCSDAAGLGDGPQRCHHRRLSNEVRGTTTPGRLCHAGHGEGDEATPRRQARVRVRPEWQDKIQRCRDARASATSRRMLASPARRKS